ncbi:CHAD domain-containing protein [Jiella sp. MQZ9-1]|uniref:CHAD domain-containing protein n=1 Tax=Jiella flava TaxID=2816857 RepID=A0A939FXK6_9HYPH|nr:CHAD domain-containing protein [Jiella flava]MBO0662005.1 CHAD domain-containing protein [Jiella flava]MCD2470668.1 CHAD domain-containing protein [Jiella flava]
MAYQIRPTRPLDAEFRKIAAAQIDRALADLRQTDGDVHAAIHEARKRFKKLRGLIRLIRPSDEALYAELNAAFRDGAKHLSGMRDKAALIEAFDDLEESFSSPLETPSPLASVRRQLTAMRDAETQEGGNLTEAIPPVLTALEQARAKIEAFNIDGGTHSAKKASRILAAGAAKTYGRARKALKRATKTRDADDLHELRKRMKYHWMHLRLLAPAWPEQTKPLIETAKAVSDDLGRDHDFAVLRAAVRADPAGFGNDAALSRLFALLDRRQNELRERGLVGARRLLVDSAQTFAERIVTLYRLQADAAARSAERPAEPPQADRPVAEQTASD